MTLTQREKYIAIGLVGLLAVLVISWAGANYVSARRDVDAEMANKNAERQKIQQTFADQVKLRKEFTQMIADGLKTSESEAKGQIRDGLDQWAASSGVSEQNLQDGQVTHEPDFDQISFKLSGWGQGPAIVRMLYLCETTTLPLRINKIVLTPVKEGQDYVHFELTVSTICRSDKNPRSRV